MTDAHDDAGPGSDLFAWHILSPLMSQGGYFPWTPGSMRPSALVTVCNEIVHGGRTRIVECGCGFSTVLLARLLRERGAGRLVALEHDGHWASLVEEQLQREGLDPIARVLHAPLQGEPPWYELAGLDGIPDDVDLLVVDGPPAFDPGHEGRRTPALSWFDDRLVDGAAVMLDDIDRPGEQEVIRGWHSSSDWRFLQDGNTGLATGHREPGPQN